MGPTPSNLSDYDFDLPESLIAQVPSAERTDSRLMIVHRREQRIEHGNFRNLGQFLNTGDRLVVNATKVVPARVKGHRVQTSGQAEILFLEPKANGQWHVLLKTRGKPQLGERIHLDDLATDVTLESKGQRGHWSVSLPESMDNAALYALLDQKGEMPLPPYIKRDNKVNDQSAFDRERYQTVYADQPGAVAAPTAGLHFDANFLAQLAAAGVTRSEVLLRVGLGTFQPISCEDFSQHAMHSEAYELNTATADAINATRLAKQRVIAVGTTALRCLESCWDKTSQTLKPGSGDTDIFIYPPRTIQSIDCLLTNFHLPKSSLMLLISAFAGREFILEAYKEAVAQKYRFFSYGDAMLIL